MPDPTTDVNGQPIDPNFGPAPIDGFQPEDPAADAAKLGLKPMSTDDANTIIAAVQASIDNAAKTNDALGAVKEIASFVAPFLTLL